MANGIESIHLSMDLPTQGRAVPSSVQGSYRTTTSDGYTRTGSVSVPVTASTTIGSLRGLVLAAVKTDANVP